jgi:nucleoside-diphosphate-sugar epimerase
MRILVAGATGAIGRQLLPILVGAGHTVFGMVRSPDRGDAVTGAGAMPVVADALDRTAVLSAMRRARPEVVVHELTAIPPRLDIRRFDREFALTNRLRREGTDHLLEAAHAVGASRFVAQSFAGWPFAREGGPVKGEDDPLDPDPPPALRSTLAAIRHLEATVTGADAIDGIVLRYGALYGPGTSIDAEGSVVEDLRRRRLPVVGRGTGVWSFVHVEDAARATLAAIERGRPGVYNIVDDEPAPVSEWLPALAAAVGAKPPLRIPAWLARLAVGRHGVMFMTEARGAANAKAKGELSWQPNWPSWRSGFARCFERPQRAAKLRAASQGS